MSCRGWGQEQHDQYPPKSFKVGGSTVSNTSTEFTVVLLALKQTNPAEDLILLVDSTAALHRLARFRSREFRPIWETCKDTEIVRSILDQLLLRTEHTTASEEEFDDDTPNVLRMTKTGERWIDWGK